MVVSFFICTFVIINFKLYYMVTKDNIKYLIQTISAETIQEELDKPNDFILLQAHIFNVGAYGTIESIDYKEEVEEEAHANGNLFCDKDTFLQMCSELEVFEY